MKLNLSLSLRAALLACYSIAAPLAVTMTSASSFSYAEDEIDWTAGSDLIDESYESDDDYGVALVYDESSYDADSTGISAVSYDDDTTAVVYDTDSTAPATLDGGWVYVWGDEFNGDTLDETKWDYELGVIRNEGTQQAYTEEAVTVSDGCLTITSAYVGEGDEGVYNVNYKGDDYSWFVYNTEYMPYSSGSVTTQNTYSFLYGRLEISVKLPDATGVWPAIWMLGSSLYYTGDDKDAWPLCGEIDILEHISQSDGLVFTTLHYTNSGLSYENLGYSYQFDASTWYDDFHVFAMEWDESQIKIYVDDFCIAIFDLDAISFADGENPFEDPQFLILNTAIGGTWCELADDPSEYPVEYLIDYVRYYQFSPTEADRGNGSIVWEDTTDATVTLTANTANLRESAGFSSGDADIIVKDADDSELAKVYVNSGNYTGDIRVDFQESYINAGGWYAGHTSGTLTGDLIMRFSGDSLGGVQDTAGSGVSVFGAMDGDIDGNVYIEFSNTGFTLGSMTSGEYSVASALRGSISGNSTLVFNGGSYQYRVLGGIAVNATGETSTIGGDVSVYVNGGVFYDEIIGGGIAGIVKGDSSIEITGGTFKDNITAGAAESASVEGATSISIYGSTGTFKDGITINASTNLSTQTTAATMSIVGEDAAYTHSLNYFAGTLTGGNTTGTRTLAFDAANLDLSYATVTNFDAITLSNSSTVTLAASTDLSASSVSISGSSLSFAAADAATEIQVSNMTLSSGSLSIGDNVSVIENGGALTTGPGSGVWTQTFTLTLGKDASLSLSDKLNIVRASTFTVEGTGEFSVSGVQLGTGSVSGVSTLIIAEGATMNITGADTAGSTAATEYAFMLGNYDCDSIITVDGTLKVNAAMSAMSGGAAITVSGLLQLNQGLDFTAVNNNYGGANVSTITIKDGGILELGTGTATADSSFLEVTMESGSTIKAIADTTIYETISYAAGGTITFAGDNSTLTMASTISGISANIEGSVAVTSGATLTTLSVASSANLSVSSAVTADNVSNAGTISLASGGSLSIGAYSGDGAIALDGGDLTVTSDTLSAGIIVGSAGASIVVDNDSSTLVLDGTISYADFSSGALSFDGITDLSLGENFALEFADGLAEGEYTIFANSVTADDLSNVQITASNQYEYSYDLSLTEGGLLKLTVSEFNNLTIDSDYEVSSSADYDNVIITADSAISLTGEGTLSATNIVKSGSGALSLSSSVEAENIVVSEGSISLLDGASISSDTLSSDSSAVSITVASGANLKVVDATDYAGKLYISGGSVEIGNATDSTAEVNLATLSLGEGSTLTLADNVQVTVGSGADNDQGGWTDTKSFTLNLGAGSLLSMDAQLCFYNNQTVNITGSGEFEVTGLRFSTYGTGVDTVSGGSTLNIGVGATMTVTGVSTTEYGTSSVNLGGWNRGANTINVDGILNINAALTQNAGSTNIHVSSTGTLQLNEGLTFYNGTSATKSTITLADGATLILGNETESAKDGLTVTVGSSTIEAYGDATVYSTLTYTEGSTVTFKAGEDEKLTMASTISGTNISANISGDVVFTAGATLNRLDIAADASLTLSSAATVGSTTVTGAMEITSTGSLSGDITLDGGSLTVSGALVNDLAVTSNSSLSATSLSSELTLSSGASLDLGNSSVSIVTDEFSLVLDYTLEYGTDYTIFTNSGADITSDLTNITSTDFDSTLFEYSWNYDDDGNISLSLSAIESEPEWNESTGETVIPEGSTSDNDFVFNTDTNDSGVDASINTGGTEGESGSTAAGNVSITGSNDVSITGDNALESSGTITVDTSADTTVTITTTVSAAEGIEVAAGSVTVDAGAITDTDVSLAEGTSLTAGAITVIGTSDDSALKSVADGDSSITADELTATTVESAEVTVAGSAKLSNTTIDSASTLDVKSGSLELADNSAIEANTTLADGASIGSDEMTITGASDSASVQLDNGSITSNSISGASLSGVHVVVGDQTALQTMSLKLGTTFVAEDYTATMIDTIIGSDASVTVLSGESLGLSSVTIQDGATFTAGSSSSSLTAVDVSLSASTDTGSLKITDSLTYEITTFDSFSDLELGGTLDLTVNLTMEQYSALIEALGADSEALATFTIAGVSDSSIESGDANLYIAVGDTIYSATTIDSVSGFGFVVSAQDVIPEPSTTTLSLLALAGLLARRRRAKI